MKCKICNKEFKAITSKHLARHNISTEEYKKIHGELVSEEYRKMKSKQSSGKNNPNYGNKMSQTSREVISCKNKGKQPHNFGKSMTNEQKSILSEKAKSRNKVWHETNSHPIVGRKQTTETKEKIKKARHSQVISTSAIAKAVQTKRAKGYDLAFFRGKTHTKETREKISQVSKETARVKSEKSLLESKQRLLEYGYSLIDHDSSYYTIKCNKCSTNFLRTRQYASISKIRDDMCPKCFPPKKGTSNAETEIADFLAQYTEVLRNNYSIIPPKELDIVLPRYKLAIEFNGLYWHSEIFKTKEYHLEKTEQCEALGYHLIHIFEDEWKNSREIVKSRLINLISKNNDKVYARKCKIRAITPVEANTFLQDHHLQGAGRANVHLGLFYKNELMSVMTFLNSDVSKRVKGWELNRFASRRGISVVGGASKLFKHFVREYTPQQITSFADRRWSTDAFYKTLGFKFVHNSSPNYWYFLLNETTRKHRYSLKKPKNSGLSEKELRAKQGYLRIYDCGSMKYVWKP